jgi:hypothetical protein
MPGTFVAPCLVLASALTVPLEVLGVWLATITLFSGAAAAWTLLGRGRDAEISNSAVRGGAIGFIAGFIIASGAALYLYAESH